MYLYNSLSFGIAAVFLWWALSCVRLVLAEGENKQPKTESGTCGAYINQLILGTQYITLNTIVRIIIMNLVIMVILDTVNLDKFIRCIVNKQPLTYFLCFLSLNTK